MMPVSLTAFILRLFVLLVLAIGYPALHGTQATHAAPKPKAACADRLDNDGDGLVDRKDPGCTSKQDNSENDAPPPPPTPQCADGVDNDGDGLVDFGTDPGCESLTDDDESNAPPPPTTECNDGLDNDGDGTVDYPEDSFCDSPSDVSERPQCSDGYDNDGDGKVDGPIRIVVDDGTTPPPVDPECTARDGSDNDESS